MEFVLTDYCNLNCKGCSHFAPLAEKDFADVDRLNRVFERVGRVCGRTVKSVYLMGGEPLLHPHVAEIAENMRKAFPTQKLMLFTNGILLPKMSQEFWDTMRKINAVIAVTRYPVAFDYDSLDGLCRSHGVVCEEVFDRGRQGQFFKFALDPKRGQQKTISHFKCYNRGCVTITGDRIYPCAISACVTHLNKACGTEFAHSAKDYIEVDRLHDVKQILALRDRPVPFCSYCVQPPQPIKYASSERKAEEWIK